jgi:hypothetical protein
MKSESSRRVWFKGAQGLAKNLGVKYLLGSVFTGELIEKIEIEALLAWFPTVNAST